MLSHHLLDAIRGKSPRYTFRPQSGVSSDMVETLLAGVEAAEKFDFNPFILEKMTPGSGGKHGLIDGFDPEVAKSFAGLGTIEAVNDPANAEKVRAAVESIYKVPDLTNDEKQFWIEGFIPLPAPVCWYEFRLGKKWHGLLVTFDAGALDPVWSVLPVTGFGDEFHYEGILCSIHPKRCLGFEPEWSYTVSGNSNPAFRDQRLVSANVMLSIYLTLMISSRSTERQVESAPVKLNKARIARGAEPLPAHTIVRIVPQWYLRQSEAEGRSERRPPRLHWRRSHKRHFEEPTGNSRWMSQELWHGKTGWHVTMIPRFRVNYASHETVSHEYKVMT